MGARVTEGTGFGRILSESPAAERLRRGAVVDPGKPAQLSPGRIAEIKRWSIVPEVSFDRLGTDGEEMLPVRHNPDYPRSGLITWFLGRLRTRPGRIITGVTAGILAVGAATAYNNAKRSEYFPQTSTVTTHIDQKDKPRIPTPMITSLPTVSQVDIIAASYESRYPADSLLRPLEQGDSIEKLVEDKLSGYPKEYIQNEQGLIDLVTDVSMAIDPSGKQVLSSPYMRALVAAYIGYMPSGESCSSVEYKAYKDPDGSQKKREKEKQATLEFLNKIQESIKNGAWEESSESPLTLVLSDGTIIPR